ncbi:MAG: hypothetical protein JST09_16700 [Bacteroidetes bacterium]|nr:hypothetical protein [Bacteroidota bacterium]MBS1607688.1 hypothetical protein [Bacteroidota bacterium]
MKKVLLISILIVGFTLSASLTNAQCSVCTRTAQQLGEKPAKGLNAGILYLAFTPFAIGSYIFYRWRKNEKLI